MGLNKYKGKWEDISDWTQTMIQAKITELINEKKQAYKEYMDYCAFIDEQLDVL